MDKYYKKVVNALLLPTAFKTKVKSRIYDDFDIISESKSYNDLCMKFGKPKDYAFILSKEYYSEENMKNFSFLQTLYSKRNYLIVLFTITSLLIIVLFIFYPNNIIRLRDIVFGFMNESQLNSLYLSLSNLHINYLLVCSILLLISIVSLISYTIIQVSSYLFTHKAGKIVELQL